MRNNNFLTQAYPFNYSGKPLVIFLSSLFIVAFYITYFVQPFSVTSSLHKFSFFWICMIHSIIPVIILLLVSFLLYSFKVKEEQWNIKYELSFLLGCLLLVGLANFYIRNVIYDNPNNFSWRYFKEEITNIYTIGFVVVLLIVSINYNRLLYKNQNKAKTLNLIPQKIHTPQTPNIVQIQTQVKKESFSLNVNDFLFAKAEGNYLEINLLKNGSLEKQLLRISISELINQLSFFPNILKIHRSYLVNIHQIKKVEGNAQGYKLTLENTIKQLPVSRSNISAFKKVLEEGS